MELPNLGEVGLRSMDSLCEETDSINVVDEEDSRSVWAEQQLKELNVEMSAALDEAVNQGKELKPYSDMLQESHREVQKKLQKHKLHVQGLVEAQHKHHLEALKFHYRDCLQQILVAKTEGNNHEARLVDLQTQLKETRAQMEEQKASGKSKDDGLVNRLQMLKDEFSSLTRRKPEMQVERKTLGANLPTVFLDDLQALMGSVGVHGETPTHQLSDASPPGLKQESPEQSSEEQHEDVLQQLKEGQSLTFSSSSHRMLKNHRRGAANTSLRVKNEILPANMKEEKNRPNLSDKTSQKIERAVFTKRQRNAAKEMTQVCEKSPLSEEDKIGVERIISKSRELLAESSSKAGGSQSDQWISITTRPGSVPTKCGTNVSDFAPRIDNKVWVLYQGEQDLGLLNESGETVQKFNMLRKPRYVTTCGGKDAIVAHGSPKSVMMYTEKQECFTLFGKFPYQRIATTTSGIAVTHRNILQWVPFEGDLNWITVSCSRYEFFNSLSVFTYNGKPVICAADSIKNMVHFFQQQTQEEFTAYPPFVFRRRENFLSRQRLKKRGEDESKAKLFQPFSISAHPCGFLAVLDGTSRDVYIVDVRKVVESRLTGMQCVVSIIPGHKLCCGEPQRIAFSVNECEEEDEENPKMWVKTTSRDLYLTPLVFLNW